MKPKKSKSTSSHKESLHDFLASIPDDLGPESPEEAVQGVELARAAVQSLVAEGIVSQKMANKTIETLAQDVLPPTLSDADLVAGLDPSFKVGGDVSVVIQPYLAQNVLSRLSSKLPSSAPVVPRGTPILPPTKK